MTQPGPAAMWRRIGRALRARPGRGQVVAALLCGVLAFALVAQAQTTSGSSGVTAARTQDLLTILSDLQGRADRLRGQVADLQTVRAELQKASVELQQKVQEKEDELAALRGTQDELVNGLKKEIESNQIQVERYRDQLRVDVLVVAWAG